MPRHLSPLELDEIAAGLAPPPTHLEACAACRARLDELTLASTELLGRPEAKRQLALLGAAPRSAPAKTSRRRLVLLAAPLAAGVALFLAWPRDAGDARLKGAPAVMLLDEADRSVTEARPGQRLTVAVGSGGYSHGAVLAIDDDGKVETLWPRDGRVYEALAPGARSRLIELVVTPGDVTVKAVFANEARPVSEEGDQARTVRLLVR